MSAVRCLCEFSPFHTPTAECVPHMPVCARCPERATLQCAKCRAVVYCSRECQRIHWKLEHHREECQPAPELVGFALTRADQSGATRLSAAQESELRRMFPGMPAETRFFVVAPRRPSAHQPIAVDRAQPHVYFQSQGDVLSRLLAHNPRTMSYFRQKVLKRLAFANDPAIRRIAQVPTRSSTDKQLYTVLDLPDAVRAADTLARLRGSLETLAAYFGHVPSNADLVQITSLRTMWAYQDVPGYALRSELPLDVGLSQVAMRLRGMLAWATTQFFEQRPDLHRIGLTYTGSSIHIFLRLPSDMRNKWLSWESVLLVFVHELTHNVALSTRRKIGHRMVRDKHGPSFRATFQLLMFAAIKTGLVDAKYEPLLRQPMKLRKLTHVTHHASIEAETDYYNMAERAKAGDDGNESSDDDDDGDDAPDNPNTGAPPPKRTVVDLTEDDDAGAADPAPFVLDLTGSDDEDEDDDDVPIVKPTPVSTPSPLASSSSSSAAAAAAAPPEPLRARPQEPVARTVLQIAGIGPATEKLMTARLGHAVTVYDLIQLENSAEPLYEWLKETVKSNSYLARSSYETARNVSAWIRKHRDVIAEWREANPSLRLPDVDHPSGQLLDVPGVDAKSTEQLRLFAAAGISSLGDLKTRARNADFDAVIASIVVNESSRRQLVDYLRTSNK